MVEIPASHVDLRDARVATLGTIDSNGRPQLTATWFVGERGTVRISINFSRRKLANLTHNPSCSVLIFEPGNLDRYVELRGTARIEPDPDYAFADQVSAKYGVDLHTLDQPG